MLYTVGEMSKATGIPGSTLRYYDAQGLLPNLERTPNGVRMFTEGDRKTLAVVDCLKKSGLSIKDIRAFMEMVERGDDSLAERLELFRERREAAFSQLEDVKRMIAALEYKCWYYETALERGTSEGLDGLGEQDIPSHVRDGWRALQNCVCADASADEG